MKTLGKTILLSAAAVALTVASLSPASADDRWHHGHGWGGNGWGYGAAGLATGLIVGSAIASQPRYVEPGYYDDEYAPPPPPRYYYPRRAYYAPPPPPPAYYAGGLRPWSPQWSRYCYDRYSTFDGRTGTFVGYDGARHFCTAG